MEEEEIEYSYSYEYSEEILNDVFDPVARRRSLSQEILQFDQPPPENEPETPVTEQPKQELQKPKYKTDRYGYMITSSDEISPEEAKLQAEENIVEARHETKWLEMLQHWSLYSTRKRRKLEERIMKGIPDSLRSKAWRYIIDPDSITPSTNSARPTIDELFNRGQHPCIDVIDADVPRTMPHVTMFSVDSVQTSLRRMLIAYSNIDPDLGYTQGMAFSAAMLRSYMDETEAFWCFNSLMQSPRYGFRSFFLLGFPNLIEFNKVWNVAFEDQYPKIFHRIQSLGIDPLAYTPSWFLCGFMNMNFPPVLRLRIFDRYIAFGTRALLGFGLVIISRHKEQLMKLQLHEIFPLLQRPNESQQMTDWRYAIKKWDQHWISEYKYKQYHKKAGLKTIIK